VNGISEVTRRDIFDELRLTNVSWSGRLPEDDFLTRIFDLGALPSDDRRCSNMASDLHMHRHNFSDWPDDWVYDDARLNLLRCDDDVFLRFLCEMVHPLVRSDDDERERLVRTFNTHLSRDGYEIAPYRYVSGKPVYAGRVRLAGASDVPVAAKRVADELGSAHVAAQVTRMETSVRNDPPLAIGSAKEFLETMCKGILSKRGVLLGGGEDLPKLLKLTRDQLKIDDGDPNGATRKILNGLATAVQGIAEIRGMHGTGHGPHPDAAVAQAELARLTVAAAVAVGTFLLDVHRKNEPAELV
jgi:hypothetical protein